MKPAYFAHEKVKLAEQKQREKINIENAIVQAKAKKTKLEQEKKRLEKQWDESKNPPLANFLLETGNIDREIKALRKRPQQTQNAQLPYGQNNEIEKDIVELKKHSNTNQMN